MRWLIILCVLLLSACAAERFDAPENLVVKSVFKNNKEIPEMYTCKGKNINPYLNIENVPPESKTFVILLEDENADLFTHWIAYNIKVQSIHQDYNPSQGMNDFGSYGYGGPCPPSGTHAYVFTVYSLDKRLSFNKPPTKKDILKKMQGHVLAYGRLQGKFG
ncbi:MAG: YbhB/YbcL family Raf kinase inhibitor-like protein [Nanobdellota archaeon]